MHKILTLDTATRTGWASGYVTETPTYGAFKCPRTGDLETDLVTFKNWFIQKLDEEDPDFVAWESPLMGQGKESKIRWLIGLVTVVGVECKERGILIGETAIQTIKVFATKNQYAQKIEMIEAMRLFGYDLEDYEDDEADTLALWHHTFFKQFPELYAKRFASHQLEQDFKLI